MRRVRLRSVGGSALLTLVGAFAVAGTLPRVALSGSLPACVTESSGTAWLGLHLVMVCGRRASGAQLPTPEQVEARLMSVQLSNISKRILRDLRTSATIETR